MAIAPLDLQNIELSELESPERLRERALAKRAEEVEKRWCKFVQGEEKGFYTWYQLRCEDDATLHRYFLDFLTKESKQEVEYTPPPGDYERREEMISVGSVPVSVMTCFDKSDGSKEPTIWYIAGTQDEFRNIEANLLAVEA